jgi:transcription elongation factor/antiterminator RfaH
MSAMNVDRSPQGWFVVRVQTNREATAQSHLQQQGLEVFNPVIQRTVRHARQFRTSQKSVFPGYMFVRFDLETQQWRRINGTRGVVCLVTMSGAPVGVPVRVMTSLMAHYGAQVLRPQFAVGDRIRLMGGPFTDLIGTLSALDPKGRIEVLLEILGMSVAVKTDLAHGVPLPAVA